MGEENGGRRNAGSKAAIVLSAIQKQQRKEFCEVRMILSCSKNSRKPISHKNEEHTSCSKKKETIRS